MTANMIFKICILVLYLMRHGAGIVTIKQLYEDCGACGDAPRVETPREILTLCLEGIRKEDLGVHPLILDSELQYEYFILH